MATKPGAADTFLRTIEEREGGWISALFDDEAQRVQQALVRLLEAQPA